MCEECRQSPCHPSCPNAGTVTVKRCQQCGEEIPPGAWYFKDFNGITFCSQDCALNWYELEEIVNKGG